MAFCGKCGTQILEGGKFCPACGASAEAAPAAAPVAPAATPQQSAQQSNFTAKVAGLNNTADSTAQFDAKDVTDNKFMAVLAYLGLLWLIPFFAKKDSKFAQYHCKQAFTLLLAEVAYSILSIILCAVIKTPHYIYGIYYGSYTPGWLSVILWLISVPLFILAIIGIINAAGGKAKELPIIGKFKFMK